MKELLDIVNKKKHVKLGNYVFSPIMQLSGGLVLDYCDELIHDKCLRVPFIMCFPQKKGAALWTSIVILTNAFLSDYVDNVVQGREYKIGDKVLIYGCVCRIKRITKENLVLEYKDQTVNIQARTNFSIEKLLTKMSAVPKSRTLNKRSKYITGLKNAKNNRNSISKILIPNDPEIINQNNLDSKVLLIAGRGKVKTFLNLLDQKVLYNEKLSKTYGLGTNLIVKPDLRTYMDFFKDEIELKYTEFENALEKLSNIDFGEKINELISGLFKGLQKAGMITQKFDNEFRNFVDEYDEDIEQLRFVASKYPGAQESLPKKLKAVVINDISQLTEFPETINGFLARKIPIIIMSNRKVSSTNDIDYYDNLFKSNPDYFRINWNRHKIEDLVDCDADDDYIDQELWNQCIRYNSQKIDISVFDGCELDKLIGILLNNIRELDEFEILQKSFYNNFYPALYAIKNSRNKSFEITRLISKFKSDFDLVKRNGMEQSVINSFEKGIQLAYDFESNSKTYKSNDAIFANNLTSLDSKSLLVPIETSQRNLSSPFKKELIFTGYPYHEYSGKYLLNSVCVDFIPKIEILCWPNEAMLTWNYLKRRLTSAYFTDKVSEKFGLPKKYLIEDKLDFDQEVETFLLMKDLQIHDVQMEEDLKYLHTFKYKGYNSTGKGDFHYKVNCQILNFSDGTFLFLPKNSKILAETEVQHNSIRINNLKFNELARGLRVFKYKKDRSLYKQISLKNREIHDAYNHLEIWREKLNSIHLECNGKTNLIKEALISSAELLEIKGAKPTLTNIRNWLFDEDMIMPDRENVNLIISAADKKRIEPRDLDDLEESYKLVKANRIHLAHAIKKQITNHLVKSTQILDGEIKISLEGVPVSIEVKTIEDLDSSNYEIEYQNTRKILC